MWVCALAPQTAFAQSGNGDRSVSLSGTIYADVTETLAPTERDAAGQTYRPFAFNVTRTYINVSGSLNKVLKFRITPDIAREISSGDSLDGSNLFRLKYAYAEIALDQWTGRFTETWIRFGQAPTPFVEGRDAVYRYRWQGPLMPEREGLISSSDMGLSAHTSLPGDYGDVQVSLINGEGYQHREVNSQKALQARVTVRPGAASSSALVRALRVTAFYDFDHYMRNADRKRGIYGVSYENGHANVGAEIVRSRDVREPDAAVQTGRGWDVFVTPFFQEKGKGLEGLFRFDHWTPDTSKSDVRRRLVTGLSYWWSPDGPGKFTAAVMLDYESVTVATPSFLQPAQRRLTLHTQLLF
jgi:hypothetical protein